MFNAKRILKSDQQNDTANNAINALKGMLDYTVNHYLTDTDAWFIRTDASRASSCSSVALLLSRRTTTSTLRTPRPRRPCVLVGWSDPRGLYGTQGA
jgi:hypothetical protein